MKLFEEIKKRRRIVAWTAVLVCLSLGLLYTFTMHYTNKNNAVIDDMNQRIEVLEELYEYNEEQLKSQEKKVNDHDKKITSLFTRPSYAQVYFTNYGLWDGESTNITASGLTIEDFEVNEDGMYTYQGDVVIATANLSRLNKKIEKQYKTHNLYDRLTLELNGKTYTGVVLDVCGACYGGDFGKGYEVFQRYDVFTTSNSIGKVQGKVYE